MNYYKDTIVITDPCYLRHSSADMKRDTIYGDWSCMVYPGTLEENKDNEEWNEKYFEFFRNYNFSGLSSDEKKKLFEDFKWFKNRWLEEKTLGEFCADGGMVAVYDYHRLDEKDKEWLKEHPHCAAIIEDFTGDVDFLVEDETVHVVGKGNKNFFSVQSGF